MCLWAHHWFPHWDFDERLVFAWGASQDYSPFPLGSAVQTPGIHTLVPSLSHLRNSTSSCFPTNPESTSPLQHPALSHQHLLPRCIDLFGHVKTMCWTQGHGGPLLLLSSADLTSLPSAPCPQLMYILTLLSLVSPTTITDQRIPYFSLCNSLYLQQSSPIHYFLIIHFSSLQYISIPQDKSTSVTGASSGLPAAKNQDHGRHHPSRNHREMKTKHSWF